MHAGIYLLLMIVMVLSAIAAIFFKTLTRAVVALGASSASLAILLFILDAPYAGAFELSVGTGLISVLFIIGFSLTRTLQEYPDAD
ncbi:MAG: Na(+)/H(+) antiporter subunit B [Anaerolineae bacterium]